MNKQLEDKVQLLLANEEDLALFQKELQEAFMNALIENLGDAEAGPIPSDEDIQQSFHAPETVIYHISLNGEKVGGVVLKINNKTHHDQVDLFYISSKTHNRGIGSAACRQLRRSIQKQKYGSSLHLILKNVTFIFM